MTQSKYSEFIIKSSRDDKSSNDKAHFFSNIFANPAAYFFYRIGLSPNQVTFLFLLCGIICSILFYFSSPIISYLFWRLHIVLDMADGNLARATKNFSKSAVGFDRSNHIIVNTTFIFITGMQAENFLLLNLFIVSFYLNYFFSRNYEIYKQSTREFSLFLNISKNLLGFEGYVFLSISLSFLNLVEFQYILLLVYSISFIFFYLMKLRIFQNQQKEIS